MAFYYLFNEIFAPQRPNHNRNIFQSSDLPFIISECPSIDVLPAILLNVDSNNYYDYVVEGYVDEQYIGGFASLSLIKAKADTEDVQIEYFVASS